MKRKIICFMLILFCLFSVSSQKIFCVKAENYFNAKSYILLDYSSQNILQKNNEKEHFEIASMVKLMTSLLTIEKIENGELNLGQKLIASEYACSMEGSQAFLDAHQEYTVEELLKSVIIASANDSSVVLAEAIGGSEENFVQLMNEKAKSLGLENTLYANSTGLPSEKTQYSSAEDVAKLLCEVIKHNLYFKFSKIWIDELIHPSGRRTELVNTNILIRKFKGVDIGKTGFTDEAGYCLSCSANKDGMRLVSVVIGAENNKERFNITTNLLNFGYANFENKKILSKEDKIDDILIKKAKQKVVSVEYEKDFYNLLKKGEHANFKTKVEINQNLSAPIKKGTIVGKVYVTKNGVVVGEVNIVTKSDVEKLSFGDSFKKITQNFKI